MNDLPAPGNTANPPDDALAASTGMNASSKDLTVADIQQQTHAFIASEPTNTTVYRDALKTAHDGIHQMFDNGATAGQTLTSITDITDLVITELWKNTGAGFDELALLAVGGYGRGELHPYSDIDICILLPRRGDKEIEESLARWVTSLWDLGLDIGSSVRTVSECETEAANDITIITNLMEARLLTGNNKLFELMQQVTRTENMWPSDRYYTAKIEEQKNRRRKFYTNAYRLEPNIKESQGGLRDIQTISWVCQRHFGTRDLSDLVTNELLTAAEFANLNHGLELLWRIRYLLHRFNGRREDRLLFDYQRDIAHAFGFTDDTNNQSIEQLMQRFYRCVTELQRLNEIMMQGIGGMISGITDASPATPINKYFQLRNGFIEAVHDQVFVHYPPALLEVFQLFSDISGANNVRANTVRLIRAHLPLINDRFRTDPAVRQLFLQIVSSPKKLTRKIRMMNRYGVLAAYLPAFDAIVGRMQYDLFHIYTVDEHTLRVIRNARRFALPQHQTEFPHCHKVMQEIKRPELLYITALFHDIAKGRGGDHSELGAVDALKFCQQHGLPDKSANLVSWVVQHHLIMSTTAQHKDISDPAIQVEFARLVGNMEHLNNLYLLTVADIRGTNPEMWNSFKQSLLESLYRSTAALLAKDVDDPKVQDAVLAERQTASLDALASTGFSREAINGVWEALGEDYFRQYRAVEIARHTQWILQHEGVPGPLVVLRHSASRGSMEVLIYMPDDKALFALITTVLDQLQLDIQSATINTTANGHALDAFYVLEADGSLIDDADRIEQIQKALMRELSSPQDIPSANSQRASRRLKHFNIPTQVKFSHGDTGFTELRVVAADRPGILSSMGRVFMRANVTVLSAHIATLGERVEDVFQLIDRATQRPLDEAAKVRLTKLLKEQI